MASIIPPVIATSAIAYQRQEPAQHVILTHTGATALYGELAGARLGRAMVVCSSRLAGSAFGQDVRRKLGKTCTAVFAEVAEHPTLAVVDRGAVLAREAAIDCLVSLGGGSAVDLAKGIAMQLVSVAPLTQWILDEHADPMPSQRPSGRLLPILSIPMTLSGAECIPSAGLRDEDGRKHVIRHPGLAATVVILDPAANLEVPPAIMLASGMNAIAHCVEALYSLARDPVSDAYAMRGLTLLHGGLSGMLDDPNDMDSRAKALNGAHLAARAIVNARTGVHHAACHVVGAAGVSHGLANAILLPHSIGFNAEAGRMFLAEAARSLSSSERGDAPTIVARAIAHLCARGGLPRRLRDVGVARGRISEMAGAVMLEQGLRFNPRQGITKEDVVGFLTAAW